MITSGDLQAATDSLQRVAGALDAASRRHGSSLTGMRGAFSSAASSWESPSSTRFGGYATSFTDTLAAVPPVLDGAAAQIRSLSSTAASLAQQLRNQERAAIQADAELSSARRQLVSSAGDDPVRLRTLQDQERAAQQRGRTIERTIVELGGEWTAACRRTEPAIAAAAGQLDRTRSGQGEVDRGPSSAQQTPSLFERVRDSAAGYLLGDIAATWAGDNGFFPGSAIAGANRVRRVALEYLRPAYQAARGLVPPPVPRVPTFANGGLGRRLGLNTATGNLLFRRVGIVGGAYGTVTGTVDLIRQGNPIDAFQERGAGYVADVASTAFSASSTAFLIAPNPVTAGLVVVTGVVWVTAELWDRRESIANGLRSARDAVGRGLDRGARAVRDVAGRGVEAVRDTVDTGRRVVSSAVDAGRDAVGNVLDGGRSVLGALNPFGG